MKRKHLKRAARQAIVLAAELDARLPAWCAVPPEDLFAAVWPLAVRLTELRRAAKRDKKAARRYRRVRREVRALLAAQEDAPAPLPVLPRLVPFDPECWRVALVPGSPVPEPQREVA